MSVISEVKVRCFLCSSCNCSVFLCEIVALLSVNLFCFFKWVLFVISLQNFAMSWGVAQPWSTCLLCRRPRCSTTSMKTKKILFARKFFVLVMVPQCNNSPFPKSLGVTLPPPPGGRCSITGYSLSEQIILVYQI